MKKISYFFLVVLLAVLFYYFPMIKYGLGQAYGQLKIIWQAEDINNYLADTSVPDSIKSKLHFIQEVRKYAVDTLGLNESDNYTTIYNQQGRPVLWVVTGCKPYKFEAKEWHFPVLGSVPYKGFFNSESASREMLEVKNQGYDVGVRTVGGWSTLGWFKDPVLSEMLNRSNGDLANLIIHELVHATVFVRDSVDFNENLASFIADKGAVAFMKDRYGRGSEELKKYLDEEHDEQLFVSHILNGIDTLESLYLSMEGIPIPAEIKKAQKQALITAIIEATDTLAMNDKEYLNFIKGQVPNNSYFMSFLRYRSRQDELERMYEHRFNKEIKSLVAYMKQKYPYL